MMAFHVEKLNISKYVNELPPLEVKHSRSMQNDIVRFPS
jgi:hypothetical protein